MQQLAGLTRHGRTCIRQLLPATPAFRHSFPTFRSRSTPPCVTCAADGPKPKPGKPRTNIPQLGQAAPVSKSAAPAPRPAPAKKVTPNAEPEIRHVKVNLPKVHDFKIKSAVYIKSSTTLAECPPEKHPEFAVIGRSNVGKSSLINMITENSKLAKVSKAPGLTKCINHFLINNNWYLVDLPGYGYAKSAKDKRMEWFAFTQQYFLERDSLSHVLLLVDASVETQPADLECANWLAEAEVPFSVAFTKVDKASPTAAKRNMHEFKLALAADWAEIPPCFTTSARTSEGKNQLLQYLAGLRADAKPTKKR